MDRDSIRQAVNVFSLSVVIIINLIANILPLNGHTTGQVSDQFPTLTTPVASTFAIWILIYLALGVFVIYQARSDQRDNPLIQRIGYWFALSCAANVVWLISWHYHFFALTAVAMLVLLASLVIIYTRLKIGIQPVTRNERLLVTAPFSLYLGWVSIVTVATISVALDHSTNWYSFGLTENQWTILMGVIITAITVAIVSLRNDIIYAAAILWTFIGIMAHHDTTTWVANLLAACIMTIIVVTCVKLANTFVWSGSSSSLSIIEHE